MPLPGVWNATPIAVVGDVVNITEMGDQDMAGVKLAPTVQPFKTLHWCQAEFLVTAVVKGKLQATRRKLVWGQVPTGCRVDWGAPPEPGRPVWRVWFLRDEGPYLRPTFDGSGFFFERYGKWTDGPNLPPPEKLGTMLLTPSAMVESQNEYGDLIWAVGDIACELLGKQECVRRIRGLAATTDPKLHSNACDYLRAQQGEVPSECVVSRPSAAK
jgi:hypothetical protein